jgi:hypothetical protein
MSTRSSRFFRFATVSALGAAVVFSTSCMTTYDAYGRPQQSVDPGLAIAGVAAAGLAGYALANANDHHHHGYRSYGYGGGYGYYGGYRRGCGY